MSKDLPNSSKNKNSGAGRLFDFSWLKTIKSKIRDTLLEHTQEELIQIDQQSEISFREGINSVIHSNYTNTSILPPENDLEHEEPIDEYEQLNEQPSSPGIEESSIHYVSDFSGNYDESTMIKQLNGEPDEPVGHSTVNNIVINESDNESLQEAIDYDPEKTDHSFWSETGYEGYDKMSDYETYEETVTTAPEAINLVQDTHDDGSDDTLKEYPTKQDESVHSIDLVESVELETPEKIEKIENLEEIKESTEILPEKTNPAFKFASVGFEFGPRKLSDESLLAEDSELRENTESTNPNKDDNSTNANENTNGEKDTTVDTTMFYSVDESLNPASNQSGPTNKWNLFNVGFTVAPDASTIEQDSTINDYTSDYTNEFTNDLDPEEPRDMLAEEFSILARSAHRLLSHSSLFGGTATKRKIQSLAEPEDQISVETETMRTAKIAHGLFSGSSLFGGSSTAKKQKQSKGKGKNKK